jgi:ankyrin repeat protein
MLGILLIAMLATMTHAEPKIAEESKELQPVAETGTYSDRILAAARAGNSSAIGKIIEESFKAAPSFSESGATALLNSTLKDHELNTFKILLGELRKATVGKDWQPTDELLAGLATDGRTELLDVLLADGIDLNRIRALITKADADTAGWIARRTEEVQNERTNLQKLVAACAKGDLETTKQLLDSGVNVNGRTVDGNSWTPLTRAAAANQVEIVKLLLERGAEVDLAKHPGWDYTPLCLTKSVEVANALKAAGANVHANLFGRAVSILTYASEFNGAPMVQWFLEQGLDPKMIGDNDQTLLFGASDAKTVEILLKAGVDPNRPDEFGGPPLAWAKNAEVAEALINGGAKLTGTKQPLVQQMIQFGSAGAIETVIKAGAPHEPAILRKALTSAVHMDYGETVEVLLKYGADPNEPGEWSGPDDTLRPLEVCAIFGGAKSAKVLLAHGADPNAPVKYGSILKVAVQNGHRELAKVLKEAGAKGVSDLAYAVGIRDQARIDELLVSPPTFADRPEFWEYVMSAATRNGNLPVVKAALQAGVPIVVDKTNGYESAAFEGQWEVLDYLLHQRKADSDSAELSKALSSAVWNSHPYAGQRPTADFEKCVELLLGAHAPLEAGVLVQAVFTRCPGGNPRVIEMLVAAGADPNPEFNGKHLSEAVTEACKERSCSTPNETIVSTLERLAHVTIGRHQIGGSH